MPLRVVALAAERSLVDRLAAEIEALPECRVVAVGVPGDDPAGGAAADVAVWDLGTDLRAARDQLLRLRDVDLPVLVLGPASLMADAVAAGAVGYLRRGPAGSRLRAALEAVALDLQVTDIQDPGPAGPDAGIPEPGLEELTAREMDVLELLVEGLPNKEIARRLGISEHTVKFHVTTVLGKIGARTRTEAVTRAIRRGLITV
jgi:DNA-binding NarL/FixJ family response regulator